jgi:ACR3 family arsenite transporter
MDDSAVSAPPPVRKRLDFFERYLSFWVLACMVAGVTLGRLFPAGIRTLSAWEFGRGPHVNIPIAVLIILAAAPCTAAATDTPDN